MNCVDFWEIMGKICYARILKARYSLRIIVYYSLHLPKPKVEICNPMLICDTIPCLFGNLGASLCFKAIFLMDSII